MAYVIWRVSDQVIVYANEFALNAFGSNESFFGKISLWDIIGPADESLITLRVQDNGIGFDPQYKDKVFEIFKRLNKRDDYPGSGMGLAWVGAWAGEAACAPGRVAATSQWANGTWPHQALMVPRRSGTQKAGARWSGSRCGVAGMAVS